MLTLSAPALRSLLTSSTWRTPPPTVSGIKTWSATRSITSTIVARASLDGGDVEERELVGAGLVVAPGDLHRVAGIAQLDEVHPLHDAPGVHVEAGDDALGEAHYAGPAAGLAAITRRPRRPSALRRNRACLRRSRDR
jgi:hypothetical protein